LFWKKKKPEIEFIHHNSDELRNAFRYRFKKGRGLTIRFKGKEVAILDISAGGLSFENQGFQPFDVDTIQLTLDIPNFIGNPLFSVGLRILTIDENHLCRCIFEQCSLEQYELIHKYVLEMQKNDLAH
jgi:hypothetical protein